MKELLCLHGFLGSPDDFNFLKRSYKVIAPDLSSLVHLPYQELLATLRQTLCHNDFHILGYSFGSRLAARLYYDLDTNGKLICLAGHLGLNTQYDKVVRKKFEDQQIELLNKVSEKEYLLKWNNLNLFSNDTPILMGNFKQAYYYFSNYGLSKQPYLIDRLRPLNEKIVFHYGELDQKYCDYARKYLIDFNVCYHTDKGHRLLQDHELVESILMDYL